MRNGDSTQWYVSGSVGNSTSDEKLLNSNAKHLIVTAAQRVWLDLYLQKKSVLEDCLKCNLNSIGKNPTLDQLRGVLYEPALKCWQGFCERDQKRPLPVGLDLKIHSHLQARLQRVTGGISQMTSGLGRVVSLKKQKKEIPKLSIKELQASAVKISKNITKLKEVLKKYNKNYYS